MATINSIGFRERPPLFKSQFFFVQILAVRYWTSDLSSLSFIFLICKMRIITVVASKACCAYIMYMEHLTETK